jgi:hypothetical protein
MATFGGKYLIPYKEMNILQCTGGKHFLSYGCEIWIVEYRLKKRLLSAEMDIRRRAARTSEILKVRNEVIRGKMGVNSVERGTKYVEMALKRFTQGITDDLSKLILTLDTGRKKKK